MSIVDSIFDNLSEWRKLPDYQLERRADIFFACYLPDILNNGNQSIQETIIPEFPIRKGTLRKGTLNDSTKLDNLSFKIDYLAVTKDLTKVFFIELKTEAKSINEDQCRRMIIAKEVGIKTLIDGILVIFKKTQAKRKYYRLLQMMERLSLIRIPNSVREIMNGNRLNGINQLLVSKDLMNIDELYIAKNISNYEICYILPRKSEKLSSICSSVRQITFGDCIEVVSHESDEFSKQFANALKRWEKES